MTLGAAPAGLPATPPDTAAEDAAATHATNEVLREITRGGLAGLLVGVLVAGVGGRLVMRLAALLVPGSVGSFTENGNIIGDITLGGSLALILLVGLLFGAVAGSLWVVISPWLPSSPGMRTLATIPIAIALGTRGLVDDRNRDFDILGHDPLVIGSLVVLVALFGPALVVVDRWLDGRLPHAGPGDGRVVAGYVLVTATGVVVTVFLVVPLYLGSDLLVAGLALLVVGGATLVSWWFRTQGVQPPPERLTPVATIALTAATLAGLVVAVREVAGALDLG